MVQSNRMDNWTGRFTLQDRFIGSFDGTIHDLLFIGDRSYLLVKWGSCWGQAGARDVAWRVPLQGPGLAGGK